MGRAAGGLDWHWTGDIGRQTIGDTGTKEEKLASYFERQHLVNSRRKLCTKKNFAFKSEL